MTKTKTKSLLCYLKQDGRYFSSRKIKKKGWLMKQHGASQYNIDIGLLLLFPISLESFSLSFLTQRRKRGKRWVWHTLHSKNKPDTINIPSYLISGRENNPIQENKLPGMMATFLYIHVYNYILYAGTYLCT